VVTTTGEEFSDSAVIIATGSKYRRLNVEGEDRFLGNGVHYCAACDGPFYKGQHVAVPGGGNSAVEDQVHVNGAFVFIVLEPNTSFLEDTYVELNRAGFILTGHNLPADSAWVGRFESRLPLMFETSVPGIIAAGDVREGSTRQVAAAAGKGVTAAMLVREYLKGIRFKI